MSSQSVYERYYSASDVQLLITNNDYSESLTIDLATGVGFNEVAPLTPIYGVGNQVPSFFVRGNSIVTGFIGISFLHEDYLNKAINYINGIANTRPGPFSEFKTYDDILKELTYRDSLNVLNSSGSIISSQKPFNLTLIFSHNNINDENYKSITIYNCRIVSRATNISVDGESTIAEGYSFIASFIK